ncbi:metal ABC transporter solute-binding protein, Zn/Mn family [Chloroflexota bacterium]
MNKTKGRGLNKSASILVALVLILLLAAPALSCEENGEEDGKIGVVVTIMPQAEFVEKVGGEKVDITVMFPTGASPHTHELTASQMKAVSNSKMYAQVGSGIEFELVQLGKLKEINKHMLVVDCSEGIPLAEMTGEHEHGDMDPHIWMSPLKAKIMVQNICEGLIQIDSANEAYYEGNRDTYLQELTLLDQDIRDRLSGVINSKRKFMVYHPSFGYFAEEYNLIMIPVEEEGNEPTGQGITNVIEQAKEYNIKVIFASPQFKQDSAKRIADEIDGSVVSIDPLAGGYIDNMRLILDELAKAME